MGKGSLTRLKMKAERMRMSYNAGGQGVNHDYDCEIVVAFIHIM